MEFVYNNLKVQIEQSGEVLIKDGKNEIFLGESKGMRFQTILKALNVGVKLTKLNDLFQGVSE